MPDFITSKADRAKFRTAERAAGLMSDGELDRAWQGAQAAGDDVRAAAFESEWDWRNA